MMQQFLIVCSQNDIKYLTMNVNDHFFFLIFSIFMSCCCSCSHPSICFTFLLRSPSLQHNKDTILAVYIQYWQQYNIMNIIRSITNNGEVQTTDIINYLVSCSLSF